MSSARSHSPSATTDSSSTGYRLDVLVEDEVSLGLKAVRSLTPLHEAQLLTYLKLSGRHVGLLLNFNVRVLKDGLQRLVNGFAG